MEANSPYFGRHLFCYWLRQRDEILRSSQTNLLAIVSSLWKCELRPNRYIADLSSIFCEGLQHLEEKDLRTTDIVGRLCVVTFGQD